MQCHKKNFPWSIIIATEDRKERRHRKKEKALAEPGGGKEIILQQLQQTYNRLRSLLCSLFAGLCSVLFFFFAFLHLCPRMSWLLHLGYLAVVVSVAVGTERRKHQVQHGPCRYTFILPEMEQCTSPGNFRVSKSLQRDSPSPPDAAQTEKKLESLESATENNTLWLQKVRSNSLKMYSFSSSHQFSKMV